MSIRNYSIRFLLFVGGFYWYATVAAQTTKDSPAQKPLISLPDFKKFSSEPPGSVYVDPIAKLDSLRKASTNSVSDSLSLLYFEAELHYESEALDHRHRVFEWQLSSSKYIFVTVNIIVFVGLLLSIWQFYLPIYKMNRQTKRNDITKQVSHTIIEDEEKNETHVSTIKLGKDGVEITSPVIGLLILVISIAFFFMYIHYVYPVSEVSHAQTETPASSE